MLWCYVVSVLTIYTLYKYTEPTTRAYIPKSQRNWTTRLLDQWGQLLKSWLKYSMNYLDTTIKNWETRKKIKYRLACAKRSGFQGYPSPKIRTNLQKQGGIAKALFLYAAIAMSASAAQTATTTRFDTDSGPIGVDNRCTACISHRIEDCVDVPQATNRVIKGVGGAKLSNVMTGTIIWKWEDDLGQVHSHRIPGSFYAPQANV